MRLYMLLVCVTCVTLSQGYRILCVFPAPSRSSDHLSKGMVDALLKAGHEVSLVTPYPMKTVPKNLTILDVSATLPVVEGADMSKKRSPKELLQLATTMARNISILALETPAVKDAIVNQQFDAVVTSWSLSDHEAGYAAIQQVPWILFSSIPMHPHLEWLVDEVRSIATVPLIFNDAAIPMTFLQRLKNTLMHLFFTGIKWFDSANVRKLYETSFGPLAAKRGVSLPPFECALRNVSILFTNSHSSLISAQSVPPNVVDIAGYHIDEIPPPLPEDLQKVMDSSEAVVFFSMGSIVKSSTFTEKIKKELIEAFGRMPYTVLWKYEEELDNLPTNVHVRAWMPQTSILAHPMTKVFITHGGLLSTLEGLYFAVPSINIPMFGDQMANAMRAVRAGYGLKITNSPDLAGDVSSALQEMMKNDRYSNQVKYLSKLFRNRPMSPSKLIPYYVELAIESKGAYHLRSKTLQYTWYQLWMLDQAAVAFAVLYILYKIIKCIVSFIANKIKGKRKVKKN